MHPSKDIIGSDGDELEGKKIVLCITGSVAAVKSPELARELMRKGAEVKAVMSDMATDLISTEMLNWATGNSVVSDLSGDIEHVDLAKWGDIILLAPSTANSIGKIASGIDDTPPTSVISVAMGLDKPICIVPAMHQSMYSHDVIRENISFLKDIGVEFLEPNIIEGKAKIPPVQEMVEKVISLTQPNDMEGKKVLITAGPTYEELDKVRILTNQSSGKMGIELAKSAKFRGAKVKLVYGPGSEPEPAGIETINVETTDEMHVAVKEELKEKDYDMFISAAAPQDFKPKRQIDDKIRRGEVFSPELVPTPGILDKVSDKFSDVYRVGFKAEVDVSDEELKKAAEKKLDEHDLDMVVANDLERSGSGFGTDTNEVIILHGSDFLKINDTKREISQKVIDLFCEDN